MTVYLGTVFLAHIYTHRPNNKCYIVFLNLFIY